MNLNGLLKKMFFVISKKNTRTSYRFFFQWECQILSIQRYLRTRHRTIKLHCWSTGKIGTNLNNTCLRFKSLCIYRFSHIQKRAVEKWLAKTTIPLHVFLQERKYVGHKTSKACLLIISLQYLGHDEIALTSISVTIPQCCSFCFDVSITWYAL